MGPPFELLDLIRQFTKGAIPSFKRLSEFCKVKNSCTHNVWIPEGKKKQKKKKKSIAEAVYLRQWHDMVFSWRRSRVQLWNVICTWHWRPKEQRKAWKFGQMDMKSFGLGNWSHRNLPNNACVPVDLRLLAWYVWPWGLISLNYAWIGGILHSHLMINWKATTLQSFK